MVLCVLIINFLTLSYKSAFLCPLVIAELDPGNISPLPANEMLNFANRGH